jgi:hypothetical protein
MKAILEIVASAMQVNVAGIKDFCDCLNNCTVLKLILIIFYILG